MITKRHVALSISVAALAIALALASPRSARAGLHWTVGGVFSVGSVDFELVFGRPLLVHGPGYYYRTRHPVRHRGYACHVGCFRDRGFTYHHSACGLVTHHFRRHRFVPERSLAPLPRPYLYRYDGYRAPYSWRDGGRYRHDRHSRYYRDGYRDRHSYDRHRDRRYYDNRRYDRRDGHRERSRYEGRRERARPRYDHRSRYRHRDDDSDSDSF